MLLLRSRSCIRKQRFARQQQDPSNLEAEPPGRPGRDRWQDAAREGLCALLARRQGPASPAWQCRRVTLISSDEKGAPFGAPFFLVVTADANCAHNGNHWPGWLIPRRAFA